MPKRSHRSQGLVYSTEFGRMCPNCGKPKQSCSCGKKKQQTHQKDGVVRVGRSTKGRKGKGVTVITGVPLAPPQLKDLAKTLKQKCGSGGTVKDGVIEIQGEHRDLLVAELQKHGWTVKKSGG